MTASRPANSARFNQTNQSNNVLAKRTRGPINKRACQRCRQGKIKCDGDAESGKACSNCDPQHCRYDNTPRKNKQVELLKHRLTDVEVQLEAITKDIAEKLTIKDLEKEILCMLYESKDHFTQYQELFRDLKDALRQSKCLKPVLVITYEILKRILDPKNGAFIPNFMQNLQSFVDIANTYEKDASITNITSSTELMNRIEENMQSDVQDYPVASSMMPMAPSFQIQPSLHNTDDQVEMAPLNLHSSDESSEPGRFEFNDETSNGPTTPTENHHQQQQQQQQQQQVVETKLFHGPNNVSHQSSLIPGSQEYNTFQFALYYPNSDYDNFEYNYLQMNDQPNTTSPTDNVGYDGFHN